jgi:hypothetical protein
MANRVAAKTGLKKKPPAAVRPAPATVLYLYGITDAKADRKPLRAAGIDGAAAVEAHDSAGVLSWVSRVSRADFGEGLQRKMEDLEWLAEASVRHQRAVAEIAGRADVLPARFGTIFNSTASLDAHLRQRAAAIRKTLERIRGAEEWGIKIFAEPQAGPSLAALATSGSDYLRKKSEALKSRAHHELPAAINEFARELQKLAAETAPVGKVSSGQRDLVWQTAVLLRHPRAAGLQRLLQKYAQKLGDAYRIEATGPWPPYSFASHAD